MFFCDIAAASAARHGGVPATALTGPQFAHLRSLAGSLHSPQLEGRWTSSSSHQRSVGRSVGRPVCVCVRFSIFILCCRPPSFSFLRVSRTLVCFHGRLMERFSLEVLVCGVVASCLSLFGFLGFTFWWRWSES